MQRCVIAAVAIIAALPALAQVGPQVRRFPVNALRGEMLVVQPPEIVLNGSAARLAPGARIRDPQNMMQLSGALVGQRLVVHYTRDHMGQPQDVWILNADERALKPWPINDAQAAAWIYDPDTARWTLP